MGNNLISLVLTNRNRDLRIVKNCLDSLKGQTCPEFDCFLVDYGSDKRYLSGLKKLMAQYPKIKLADCTVQGQLWNKSRAINIALRQCQTPYFVAGDIDMIFRNDFVEKLNDLKNPNQAVYFQVGFLGEEESKLDKHFENYVVKHKSSKEATGITLYPTEILKSINGYDEFYHGWGAEDTDVHIRLKNMGVKIKYYDKEILLLHQWHPKIYRAKNSVQPFHSQLERINHAYLMHTENTYRTIVNLDEEWGTLPKEDDYIKLESHDAIQMNLMPTVFQVNSFLTQFKNFRNETVSITINPVHFKESAINTVKKLFGKKYTVTYKMEDVNNLILEEIIKNYRNLPYHYRFDREKNQIFLKMYFPA